MSGETKRAKFRRLAKTRVRRVTDGLRKIGNLASPNYEYTPAEVEQLFCYLQNRLDEARLSFKLPTEPPEFRWGSERGGQQ